LTVPVAISSKSLIDVVTRPRRAARKPIGPGYETGTGTYRISNYASELWS
jgi:hypothetical protein